MQPVLDHEWDLSKEAAHALQIELAARVIKTDQTCAVKTVAGVDAAYDDQRDMLLAALVILDADTLEILEKIVVRDTVSFPYIPGLFSFREIPPLSKALKKAKIDPDLIICDGHGLAHQRRFGLACHLGVLFDVPTIGCGKSRLVGHATKPGRERGSCVPLVDKDEVIGCVLRTRSGIKPVYVSIGHKISLQTACQWILKLTPKYRLPETTRLAHHLVKKELSIT